MPPVISGSIGSSVPQQSSGTITHIDILKEEVAALKQDIATIKKDLSKSQLVNIETMAIFVALFSFVSVQFQLFKDDITKASAAGFSLILLGGLLAFLLLLKKTLTPETSTSKFSAYICATFLLITGGVTTISYDSHKIESGYFTKMEVNEMLASSTKAFSSYKACIQYGYKPSYCAAQ